MRNRPLHLLLCFAFGLMTACTSRIPQPEAFSYSKQRTMQAAHHWNILANDVANRINNELIRQHRLHSPVYVRHSCGKPDTCVPGRTFPFDEGFNDLLTTQLVNFGIPTLNRQEGSTLVVDYKVQVVAHSDSVPMLRPGLLTALTAGIVVLRNASPEVLAVAAAAAADYLNTTLVLNGHYEVIITTSIIDNNRYLMRSSDIYYIDDADFWQYRKTTPAPEIEMTGPGGSSIPPSIIRSSL